MKASLLAVVGFLLFSVFAFGDDSSSDQVTWRVMREKAVESVRKELADPKTTEKQKAAIADFELTLLDDDARQIDGCIAELNRKIAQIEAEQKAEEKRQTAILNPPTPPPPPGPSWHQVAQFSGNTGKNTEPFVITSNRWRVKWSNTLTSLAASTMAQGGVGNAESVEVFAADAMSDDTPAAETQSIVGGKIGSGSDSTEMRGSGNWYIKVTSANTDWTMSVEEYR